LSANRPVSEKACQLTTMSPNWPVR